MSIFSIPLHIEKMAGSKNRQARYNVSPLFYNEINYSGNDVDKVIAKVRKDLFEISRDFGKSPDHRSLALLTTPPVFKSRRAPLALNFRRGTVRINSTIFITLKINNKKVSFTPLFPDIWFECGKFRPEEIASEVLSKEVKKLEKLDKIKPENFDSYLNSHHWIDYISLGVSPKSRIIKNNDSGKFFLGFSEEMDGETELRKVGRNLDDLFPNQLKRVRGCYREVEQVFRMLNDVNSPPTLLLGPNSVGKSAIVQESNFQKIQLRGQRWAQDKHLYLVSPQRIISGMSYVGQWESRILAILKECRLRDHVLYFDNLPGLFSTSTGSETMTIAHVLKPEIEKGKIRILAEATQEQFAIVKEKDRSFAELFSIIHIREPEPAALMDIMFETCRETETSNNVEFDLNVLPTVLELTRRYQRHLAFPGKSVTFIERLSLIKKPVLFRDDALNYFKDQCGLSLDILDSRKTLTKEEVISSLSEMVIGQKEAVTAMADAVIRCKARLSDPSKPLAAYLFAGPTGVGKTECAKALATTLFNSEERLLRFDMNEYKTTDAVTRLAGNAWQPEGLLTSAIRNQPFAVILLDEIEKAHPAVFDLLLQVLGEGRLTDSLGRTADFTNSIIIMTSNLGSRESSQTLSFNETEDPQTYLSSVKKFFKPEFFNRIDKVIPFESLGKSQIRNIAAKMIEKVLKREGLKRRQCILDVSESVIDLLVDLGYSPKMGARAMKRTIEREIASPVAEQLVQVPGGQPVMLQIGCRKDKLKIKSTPFTIAESTEIFQLEESFPDVKNDLLQLLEDLNEIKSEGIDDWNNLNQSDYHFFNMKERIEGAVKIWDNLDEMLEKKSKPRQNPFSKLSEPMTVIKPDADISLFFGSSIRNYTRKCLKDNPVFGSDISHRVKSVVSYSYFLELLARADLNEAQLEIKGLSGKSSVKEAGYLLSIYEKFFEEELHFAIQKDNKSLSVKGYGAKEAVALECGIHLFYSDNTRPLPVLVSSGNKTKLEVVRAYTPDGGVFDFRSLLLTKNKMENWQLMRFMSYSSVFMFEEMDNG